MTGFADAMAALGLGLKALKDLNEVGREWDKAELKLRIADLATALSSAKLAMLEVEEELRAKAGEIAKLRDAFREKQNLVEHEGYHYRRRTDGKPQGRPYCPRCLSEGRLLMTVDTIKPMRPVTCPQCKNDYCGAPGFSFEEPAAQS